MIFPNYFYTKNLRFRESGYNFKLNLAMKSLNLIYFPNIIDYSNSCNNILLNKYDSCDETRGKISFIPIDYLKEIFNERYFEEPKNFKNRLDEKKYYLKFLLHDDIFNENFFKTKTYKDIPLIYFKKPLLTSTLSKTIDMNNLKIEQDGILNNSIFKYPVFNHNDLIENTRDEWLSVLDLSNIIKPNIYTLDKDKRKLIYFIPYFHFNNTYLNIKDSINQLFNNYKIPNETRFIIFIILYQGHFTSVIIDKSVQVKGEYKKFAYFFNSASYDPYNFNLNKNYWFIDSSLLITNHRELINNKNYKKENNKNLVIETLCEVLKERFQINNFVFNTFKNQILDSECGIFSTMFLTCLIKLIDSKKDPNKILVKDIAYIYFNLLSIGADHTYSMFRGLFYFTLEDIEENKITEDYYKNTCFIYKIKNKKFNEFQNLYKKNLEKLIFKLNNLKNDLNLE